MISARASVWNASWATRYLSLSAIYNTPAKMLSAAALLAIQLLVKDKLTVAKEMSSL